MFRCNSKDYSSFCFSLPMAIIVCVLVILLCGISAYAQKNTTDSKIALTMESIDIQPTVIALKVEDISKGATEVPKLVFKFGEQSDSTQTLHVTYNWYPIGYTSDCSYYTSSYKIAPNLSEITVEAPQLSHFGIYQVLANVYDIDMLTGQYGQTMVAVIPNNSCNEFLSTSPFGMGTSFSSLESEEKIRIAIERADMAGIRWVRENIQIPTEGNPNYNVMDATIGSLLYKHIGISGIFDLEHFLTPETKTIDTPLMAHFFKQQQNLVKRYSEFENKGITSWELSSSHTPLPNLSPSLYAQLYNQTHDLILQHGKGSTIIAEDGGKEWTDQAVETLKQIDKYNDAIGFSGMVFNGRFSDQAKSNLTAWSKLLESKNRSYTSNLTTESIWLTNIGWVANHSSSWQERQADFLVQSYVKALANGYGKVFWQQFITQDSDDASISCGLLEKSDFSPRIGYVSYAAMVHLLEGSEFVRMDTLGSGINIYTFRSLQDKTETAVIWCDKNAGTIAKPKDMILDCDWVMFDQFSNGTIWEKDKDALCTISRTPVYIRSAKGGIAQTLMKWSQLGFPQVGMNVNAPPLLDKDTVLTVTLHNASINAITSGVLALISPNIQFDTTQTVTLNPGQTISVPMKITHINKTPENNYPLNIVLQPQNKVSPFINQAHLFEHIINMNCTPKLDCNFNEWNDVKPVYCLLRQNMTEIKPCMDWMVSATLKMQSDADNIYAAVLMDIRSNRNFFDISESDSTPVIQLVFAPRDKNNAIIKTCPFDIAIQKVNSKFDTVSISNQENGISLAEKTVMNSTQDLTTMLEIVIPLSLLPKFELQAGNSLDVGLWFLYEHADQKSTSEPADSFENVFDNELQTMMTYKFR